jgi:hypothetical protein
LAYSRIDAMAKGAKTKISLTACEVRVRLLEGSLSDEAKKFLESMPTARRLDGAIFPSGDGTDNRATGGGKQYELEKQERGGQLRGGDQNGHSKTRRTARAVFVLATFGWYCPCILISLPTLSGLRNHPLLQCSLVAI